MQSVQPTPTHIRRQVILARWQRIEQRRRKALNPWDFCAKWVPLLYDYVPDDVGYKSRCIALLSNATGRTEGSIRSVWGADFAGMPDDIAVVLNMVDLLWSQSLKN
jgi:hypothetical protein